MWCSRRLSRVPWTARRSNQSILKEISPEYPSEGLMPKLKLQYFGHLMRRADSFEKPLMPGKFEVRRRRGLQRIKWLDGITDWMYIGLGGLGELVMDGEAWHAAVHGVTKSHIWLSDWTELNIHRSWNDLTERPFQLIQCTVVIFTSTQVVGIDMFYTYASLSCKFQNLTNWKEYIKESASGIGVTKLHVICHQRVCQDLA